MSLQESFDSFDISGEKLYYFAHPYTGDGSYMDRERNYLLCMERTLKLMANGVNVFSPIAYSHNLDVDPNKPDWFGADEWLQLDKIMLDRCDGIIMAPNWEQSEGCVIEFKYATDNNKIILFWDKLFKK